MAYISYTTLSHYFARIKHLAPSQVGQLIGKKGIIIFTDCNWTNASGHVDLFNGKEVEGHGYFNECGMVTLYGLK